MCIFEDPTLTAAHTFLEYTINQEPPGQQLPHNPALVTAVQTYHRLTRSDGTRLTSVAWFGARVDAIRANNAARLFAFHIFVNTRTPARKSNLHYIRAITPKRVTSGGVHLHGLPLVNLPACFPHCPF